MKAIILFISFIIPVLGISQETLNQYDQNGLRDGVWKKYFEKFPDQLRYEGQFSHGKEVGLFKFYRPGTEHPVATKRYSPDTEEVEVTFYTEKGEIISTGSMIEKERTGTWKYYHEGSDQIMMIENYKNGILHGEKMTYYPNGQLTEKSFYSNGKLQGEQLLYADSGVLLKKLHYKNGELEGPAKFYNAAGELIIEGSYKNNRHSGTWKYYENGKLKEEKVY